MPRTRRRTRGEPRAQLDARASRPSSTSASAACSSESRCSTRSSRKPAARAASATSSVRQHGALRGARRADRMDADDGHRRVARRADGPAVRRPRRRARRPASSITERAGCELASAAVSQAVARVMRRHDQATGRRERLCAAARRSERWPARRRPTKASRWPLATAARTTVGTANDGREDRRAERASPSAPIGRWKAGHRGSRPRRRAAPRGVRPSRPRASTRAMTRRSSSEADRGCARP
jgi:hypothetical protein